MVISFPRYVATFTSALLHIFNTSTRQLLFRSSYFLGNCIFWGYAYSKPSLFSKKLFFSEQLFFQRKTFTSSHFLDTEWKYLEKSYIFEAVSTFSKKLQFGRKLILQKSNIPHYLVFWRAAFLSWLLFQKTQQFMTASFSEELLFYNVLSQKSYCFTFIALATLPIYQLLNKWAQYHLPRV